MFWVRTNNTQMSSALNHFTVITYFFDSWSNSHDWFFTYKTKTREKPLFFNVY